MMNPIKRAWNGMDRNMKIHNKNDGRHQTKLGKKETERNQMNFNVEIFLCNMIGGGEYDHD